MLLVQQFLQNYTFGDLSQKFGVYASFSKCGSLISLNYDQIEAKETDPLAQQCRGLILGTVDGSSLNNQAKLVNNRLNFDDVCPGELKVIAAPFWRFFNQGQGECAPINWNDPKLKIQAKMDGTLVFVYKNPFTKTWNVATRSVPEADLPLEASQFTFRTLFEKALKDTANLSFEDFTTYLNPNLTYCFELCSPYNAVVVRYPTCSVTLLGARNITTLQEVSIDRIDLPIPKVKEYPLRTISDLINWVEEQNPLEFEGVVVLDSNFNRIKIKNSAYVIAHKTKDLLVASDRNCLELLLNNKEDDVIPILAPEIVENLQQMKLKLSNLIHQYNHLFYKICDELPENSTKKDFALAIKDLPWQAPLFQIYDKKAENMHDFIQKNKKGGEFSNSFLDKILELLKNSKIS